VKISNPFLYEEWAEAGLIGLGPENEWVFESCDPALLLLSGHRLEFMLELPLEKATRCRGEVAWITIEEGDRLVFGVHCEEVSFDCANAAGEFFLQNWGAKPSDLAKLGIILKKFKERLRFSFVATQDEYLDVLKLRRNAYVHAGKRDAETLPEQFSSNFDKQSRILAAYHDDAMVASLTLTFPLDNTSGLRSETMFPGKKYPVAVPAKETMLEAHSFCTHKDYRGGDLFQGMVAHALRCMILSDREWMITLATRELLPLYKRIGFKSTGATTAVPELNEIEHTLILLHRNAVLYGSGMNPFHWDYFYGELMKDLSGKGLLEFSAWRKTMLSLMFSLGALGRKWTKRRLIKEFRRYMARVK
jgi:hypothetical protein